MVFLAGIAGNKAVFEVRNFSNDGQLTSFEVKTYALVGSAPRLIGSLQLDKIHTVTVHPTGVVLRNTLESILAFYRLNLKKEQTLTGAANERLNLISIPRYMFKEGVSEPGTIRRSVRKIK